MHNTCRYLSLFIVRCCFIQHAVFGILSNSERDLMLDDAIVESSQYKSASLESPIHGSALDCHDSSSYRNPINALWTCEHHQNIPCESWINLGLSAAEFETLISSCPISCNTPCTTTTTSTTTTTLNPSLPTTLIPSIFIEIEIFLYPLTNLMQEEDVNKFQSVSQTYLSSYLKKIDTDMKPSLKSFTFNSQVFVNTKMLRHDRRLTNSRTLRVIATAALNSQTMRREELTNQLHNGVESEGYINALKTDISLEGVSISCTYMPEINGKIVEPNGESNASSGAVAGLVASFAFVVCAVVSIIMYRRRLHMRHFANLSPNNKLQSFDEGLVVMSRNDSRKDLSSYYDSRRKPKGKTKTLTDFKLRVDECEMKRTVRTSTRVSSSLSDFGPINLIPPMIVIDNIDGDIAEALPNELATMEGHNEIVPSAENDDGVMRVTNIGASSALAAFSATNSGNPMQACLLLKECTSNQPQAELEKDRKSPLSLISSRPSIGETASAFSTPASAMTGQDKCHGNEGSPSKKKSVFTFDPEFDLEPEDDFTVLFEKKMKEVGKKSFNLKDLFKRNKTVEEERSSVQMSHYESDAEMSDISSVARGKDRLSEFGLTHSPLKEILPHEINKSSTMMDDEQIVSEIDKQSPSKQHDPSSPHCKDEVKPSSTSHNRSASDTSLITRFFYTFEAPISGKLGIVIQSNLKPRINRHQTPQPKSSQVTKNYGPSVWEIKGYSPLLGMIQLGDIIISVDGINTKYMSTSEITSLLATKRSDKGENDGKIKLTIMSREAKAGFDPEPEPPESKDLDKENIIEPPDLGIYKEDKSDGNSFSESDRSFHLIGTGMSDDDDDDSFHMMAGAEDFL